MIAVTLLASYIPPEEPTACSIIALSYGNQASRTRHCATIDAVYATSGSSAKMFLLFLWFLSIRPSKPAPARWPVAKADRRVWGGTCAILEGGGSWLHVLAFRSTLNEVSNGIFTAQDCRRQRPNAFPSRRKGRPATQIEIAGVLVERNAVEPAPGVGQLRITPLRPMKGRTPTRGRCGATAAGSRRAAAVRSRGTHETRSHDPARNTLRHNQQLSRLTTLHSGARLPAAARG